MEIFNPYDLNDVARLNKWLEDNKKGICKPFPFRLVKTVKNSRKGVFAPSRKRMKVLVRSNC